MIDAGALAVAYNLDAAHGVEKRCKEGIVLRRQPGKARKEAHGEETQNSLRLLADHAAEVYTKPTVEIERVSGAGSRPLRCLERVPNLREGVTSVADDGNGIIQGKESVVIVDCDERAIALAQMTSCRL